MRIKFLLLAAMVQLALRSSVAFAVPSSCNIIAGKNCSYTSAPGGTCTGISGTTMKQGGICTDPNGRCTACFTLTIPLPKPKAEQDSVCQCGSGSAEWLQDGNLKPWMRVQH